MSDYAAEYRQKLTTPQNAAEMIPDGSTIVHGLTIAEPPALLGAIAERIRQGMLKGINVYSLLPLGHAGSTVLSPDLGGRVHGYSWFATPADRERIKSGYDYYVPNTFQQVPRLCRDYMDIDITVTAVSPMDKNGYFSFGTANDFTSTAARHCKKLIVEVNEKMPRVFGDSFLHISEVTAIIENHVPLQEMVPPPPRLEDQAIGQYIAEMVPNGATIQLGVGGIPNSIARYLRGHQDLGIHTEVFGPGMVDLIQKGVVTGRSKTLHPGKHVFTVIQGIASTYEFAHDNPGMSSQPVCYTNDPAVIAQNSNMVSINSIIEVDLLGQCNAEFLDGHQYSGTGGQLDFVRGAFNSPGGKAILAFYSTARKGQVSRVVSHFQPGTAVTTPRMDVHYLVTEYGAVNLKGKNTRERALDIISLAHPKFREDLLKQAEKIHLI